MQQPTQPTVRSSEHIRDIARDIIITILTCGLYNIYIQSRQIHAVNAMIREDKYSFGSWFLLTLVTCGLYHIYHEYRKTTDLCRTIKDLNENEPILTVLLTIFGMAIVADAIQQTHINRYFGSTAL